MSIKNNSTWHNVCYVSTCVDPGRRRKLWTMPSSRKNTFVPGEYYHIYSRTVLNVPEFEESVSANKLAQSFLLANSTKSGEAFKYLRGSKNPQYSKLLDILGSGERLTDILCYVIMPDHYHMLLKEKGDGGIQQFIHKCNTSIAKYINTQKERRGPLFESRFKSKHVDSNEYLLHLSLYIHLNPLDFLVDKSWRTHELENWALKKEKLLAYPWSSLKAFLDEELHDPILSGQEIITNQFENGAEYEKFLRDWSEASFAKVQNFISEYPTQPK